MKTKLQCSIMTKSLFGYFSEQKPGSKAVKDCKQMETCTSILILVNQFEIINACKHIIKSLSCLILELFKIVDWDIQPVRQSLII